eukprot:TRINITY_DN8556_c0_g1_i1.p1 TRINITY_DN8556_c0_g1~~TRINITY_DN8556_c0_g1_i1.p1  ORF type:complete len:688 (+),score=133.05 TRINITY_DN8556_c0_g1_i1:254-2065(+)
MPESELLTDEEFWTPDGFPNIARITTHLFNEGRIKKEHFMSLLEQTLTVLSSEETLIQVEPPLTICGDVHGQYYDLMKLFAVGGDPLETTYLFLGDYVDRGNFSCEVLILLFSYKLLLPNSIFMLRGNHECRHLTQYFTFKEECVYKYDMEVYDMVMSCFDALPLAALVNKQFLCLHGGLSPEIQTLDDIAVIDRFTEPPQSGPMCDILWSDPMEDFAPEVDQHYAFNKVRGCSYIYGFNAVVEFLERNKLLSVIRAHEAQDAGYLMHTKNPKTGFPALITLFSAPNYLDTYNNKGAVLRYSDNVVNIKQFNHTSHPYYLPSFMNVFVWSVPFVVEKVIDIFKFIKFLVDDEEAEMVEEQERQEKEHQEQRREILRNRVRTVSRILGLFKAMRKEREAVVVPALSPKHDEVPPQLKKRGTPLRESLGSFSKVRALDISNEKRPDGVERIHQQFALQISDPSSPTAIRQKKSREILNSSPTKSPRTESSWAGSPRLVESAFDNHVEGLSMVLKRKEEYAVPRIPLAHTSDGISMNLSGEFDRNFIVRKLSLESQDSSYDFDSHEEEMQIESRDSFDDSYDRTKRNRGERETDSMTSGSKTSIKK